MERPEIIKSRIKNGNIETEAELRETFADFADNNTMYSHTEAVKQSTKE